MGTIGEISALLDKIPLWKRLKALPQEVEHLRARVDEIERKMRGGSGLTCPMCNSAQFVRESTKPDEVFGDMGLMQDSFRCQACGHQECRQRDASQR